MGEKGRTPQALPFENRITEVGLEGKDRIIKVLDKLYSVG
jgi:hypothetical protein